MNSERNYVRATIILSTMWVLSALLVYLGLPIETVIDFTLMMLGMIGICASLLLTTIVVFDIPEEGLL